MKNSLFLWLLIIPLCGITQSDEYKDIIYLANGSILKGKLIKYDHSDTVKFALSETEIITTYAKNVKKVKMAKPSFHVEELYRFHSPTWYLRSQFSFLYSRNQGGYSLSVSGGYQFNHWLAAGVGSGIDNYYATQGFNMFPAYAEARIGMYKKNKTPYLGMRTGYGFVSTDEELGQTHARGGWFFNPVFGYRLGAGNPYLDIYAGVRFQSAYYESLGNQFSSEMTIDFRRYDIGFGITF
ncbi:MAG: hypothetical protein IPK35_23495 [Saprospiraceae bacterium]|nr:hypothetical protein [Saprospiraceae bacterium]